MAFRESGTTLSQKNSPFVCQVDVETAGCLYNQNALQQTLDQLEKVRGSPKRYPSVDARLRWLRGLVLLLRGHPRESLNDYQISLATFGRIGEIENTGVLHALTAECLTYLNRRDEAWLHRQQALRLLDADIDWRPLALGDAARAALTEGNPHLSIAFLDEQVRLARTSSNSPLEAEALRTRGAAQLEIRDFAAATRDLDEATQAAGRIGDDLIRERATADLLEVRGRACLAKAPTVCANSLTGALRFFQKAGNHFRIARLCLARGDHYRSIQRLDLARADYELGVDEIEMQRERLPDEDERLSYFETSAALFDRLIELLARAREVAPSLNMAERARARVLLDAITDPAYLQLGLARPLRFQDFASRLPREVTIVAFHVLPSALCVWIATPNHLSLSLTEISSAALEHEAKEFRRALENPVADFGSLLRLSRTLIGPVLEHIRPDRMIVFVPDRFLNTVPFTALIDPRDKRHLIETHAISVAPSISVLSRLFEKSGSAEDWRHQSVLAIGNPKTDETLFPRLASLPAAEAEARESATRYPGSQLLIGSRATKSAVLALAGRHQIIHFAGHAIADGLGPGRAALILAPDSTTGDSGIFYADEIASERFERLHLVVLSGCRTGVGSVRENEGVMSVARGFLAAGAPRVLATLWDVSETSASSFSRIFLRCLSEGMPPDASLRLAVKTLRSRASPGGAADWAAFQLVGLPTTRSTQLPGQTERS
ncbi:MAG: CHAT domain-containing protein, partial [Thermoanaerobaculia bacterium]